MVDKATWRELVSSAREWCGTNVCGLKIIISLSGLSVFVRSPEMASKARPIRRLISARGLILVFQRVSPFLVPFMSLSLFWNTDMAARDVKRKSSIVGCVKPNQELLATFMFQDKITLSCLQSSWLDQLTFHLSPLTFHFSYYLILNLIKALFSIEFTGQEQNQQQNGVATWMVLYRLDKELLTKF